MLQRVSGSFRDPAGYLFWYEKKLYRFIDRSYQRTYEYFIKSGLYDELIKHDLLVTHQELSSFPISDSSCYKVIQPYKISCISYPYEWCFSQLQDAALLTLNIQKKALHYNMTLKDCSAYNVQFDRGNPLFIDTLSFERYSAGTPWVAYRQFCQHFLAPLALMSYKERSVSCSTILTFFTKSLLTSLCAKIF